MSNKQKWILLSKKIINKKGFFDRHHHPTNESTIKIKHLIFEIARMSKG